MIGDRELWRVDHDRAVGWAGTSGRRAQVDGWLTTNGLPPGSMLRGGTVRAVVDLLGRPRLLAQLLDGSRTLRVPLLVAPPPKLPLTRPGTPAGVRRGSR